MIFNCSAALNASPLVSTIIKLYFAQLYIVFINIVPRTDEVMGEWRKQTFLHSTSVEQPIIYSVNKFPTFY
jgi:hypothetical protein